MCEQNLIHALKLISNEDDALGFLGPTSDQDIALAEVRLGFRLPASFRRFVQELGGGGIGSLEIFGVSGSDFDSPASTSYGVWLTLQERVSSNLPNTMFIIHDDGMGGLFILDVAKGGIHDSDPPVEVWYPGLSKPGEKLEKVASNFGVWLLQEVHFALERSALQTATHDGTLQTEEPDHE